MNIKKTIFNYWESRPLILIILVAAILRLVSAVFAKGWGMLDDHFLVIEIAQSWVDGGNFNHWLPWAPENEGPTGHTFFYAGLHFVLFTIFKWIHLDDPQIKMFVVRLIHAAFSMVVVVLGYKITQTLSDKKSARLAGLLLASFWFMPWLSVRNLVEIVAIPFLFISTWLIVKPETRDKMLLTFLWAGFVAGISFSIRYQTMMYAGGMGLALLFQKQFRQALIFGIGYLISVVVLQGVVDMLLWGYPFAEFIEYVRYNVEYRNAYISGEWYKYLLLLTGILIPPISIFLFTGMFKNYRKRLIIFLPTLIFLAFHSYFPNKQERFILTIVPFIILIGIMGWNELVHQNNFLLRNKKFLRGAWIFFWSVNIVLLIAVSTMYSKRARVEAMTYLYNYDNVTAILLENTNGTNIQIMPQFYLGEWILRYEVTQVKPMSLLPDFKVSPEIEPRFVIFFHSDNIEERVKSMELVFPNLEYETTVQPGFVDKVMHWLNPYNVNEEIFIYRNEKFFPEKIGNCLAG